jgi:hypothetical protein
MQSGVVAVPVVVDIGEGPSVGRLVVPLHPAAP